MWYSVEPEERVGNEVVDDLIAAVVVNERAPVGMRTLARVGMLVKMRPVELGEAKGVAREVGRCPVEKHANAGLVAAVDELHEFRRRAVAACRCIISDCLVAPRAVEGMLHDREQLEVGVSKFLYVGNELFGEFVVSEPAVAFVGITAPTSEVNLVNRDRLFEPWRGLALRDPVGVRPLVCVESGDDGAGVRT